VLRAAVILATTWAGSIAVAQAPRTGSVGDVSGSVVGGVVERTAPPSNRATHVARLERTPAPRLETSLPLREALERVAAASGVEIRGLWVGRADPGLDPEMPVQAEMPPHASCLDLLERILDESSPSGEPAWWQTTKLGIEVGLRPALLRPRAMETRVYDVKDLLVRVPMFRSTGVPQVPNPGQGAGGGGAGGGQGGGGQGGGQGGGAGGGAGGQGSNTEDTESRERRIKRVEDLIALIERSVEPDVWDPAGGSCTIASHDGLLVIRAPDFVHRLIEDPVSPRPRTIRRPGD
jgi:uncharacterized membrane protein YgcG